MSNSTDPYYDKYNTTRLLGFLRAQTTAVAGYTRLYDTANEVGLTDEADRMESAIMEHTADAEALAAEIVHRGDHTVKFLKAHGLILPAPANR